MAMVSPVGPLAAPVMIATFPCETLFRQLTLLLSAGFQSNPYMRFGLSHRMRCLAASVKGCARKVSVASG